MKLAEFISSDELQKIIELALQEDLGAGDITSLSTLDPNQVKTAQLICKEKAVICGLEVFENVFNSIDNNIICKFNYQDGHLAEKNEVIATVSGNVIGILSAERTALNFMQRMSGIATMTNTYVQKINHTNATILDTRKTVPGLRLLDKYSVRTGGGRNHRIGLFDMILIKDNHISSAGRITNAVNKVLKKYGHKYKIEVEIKNLDELKEALNLPVNRILLDNMSVSEMKKAVEMTHSKIELEASGNVSIDTVVKIAETGVDYISIGALTHSVKAADLSLLI